MMWNASVKAIMLRAQGTGSIGKDRELDRASVNMAAL